MPPFVEDGDVTQPRLDRLRSSGPFQFAHTFAQDSPGGVEEKYELKDFLGKGAFGMAHVAICRDTGTERAVKCVSLQSLKDATRFQEEIEIAKQLDHPNVVRLFEIFRAEDRIYLVMELCTGGELFERIAQEPEGFDEGVASNYVRQMLGALCYLHANCFAHRDVKPDNFLLKSKAQDAPLMLIDFGLAYRFQRGERMGRKVGTPYYVAPEVLDGSYDERCDVWSAGVLCFILLCGYPPFCGRDDKAIVKAVRAGHYDFRSPDWDAVSDSAKDLVRQLLTYEPAIRPSAAEALTHPWLAQAAPAEPRPMAQLGSSLVAKLQEFHAQGRLRRVALTAVAQQLRDEEVGPMRDAFAALDEDGDGMLSPQEVREGIARAGLDQPPGLDDLLRSVDSDGSGLLDYTEFLAATVDQQHYAQQDICRAAFRTFDLNGDGKITQDELERVLAGGGKVAMPPTAGRIQRMVSEADANGDGCIDFEEFYTLLQTVSPVKDVEELRSPPGRKGSEGAGACTFLCMDSRTETVLPQLHLNKKLGGC